MNRTQRVIWSDNGTLKEISKVVNELGSDVQTLPLVAAEDAVYIGTELPFNHKHFEVGTASTAASVVQVALWTGVAWQAAVDVVDETQATEGQPFGRAGVISFSPDIDNAGWGRERVSETVTGLAGTKIYGLYWARLKVTADLSAGLTLKYVGERFSNDTELFKRYPDLANTDLIGAYASGKTNWDDQHLIAAEALVRDLRRRAIVVRREQILRAEIFGDAAVHMCARIIYQGLGQAYAERVKAATKDYGEAMNVQLFEVDQNGDGIRQSQETTRSMGYLSR